MVTQRLLWGYSGGQFGGDMGLSLGVLWGHFRGILKMNLEVLYDHFGDTLGSLYGYYRIPLELIWGYLGGIL